MYHPFSPSNGSFAPATARALRGFNTDADPHAASVCERDSAMHVPIYDGTPPRTSERHADPHL